MVAPEGLRERKKQAMRAALSQAARELMLKEGLNAVSPESVAEIVGVSARTFRNYFASRDEAIAEALLHEVVAIPDLLRARPAGEPIWDSLMHVLPDAFASALGDRQTILTLMRIAHDNPGLRAHHGVAFDRIQQDFTQVIAERTGANPDQDVAVWLLSAAARAAMGAATDAWVRDDRDLADLVRECLTQQRAGIPLGNELPKGDIRAATSTR
jgi:AcrR family transcriptional regulator